MYDATKEREKLEKEQAKQEEKAMKEVDKAREKQMKQEEKDWKAVDKKLGADLNPDPITGAPGSHPVGTGAGAMGGAAAGAAIGTAVGGPVGFAVGGAVGAVAGGLAGKGVAEQVNPTVEDAYWRSNYSSRPYVQKNTAYEVYQPAYRYGWEARDRFDGRSWETVETDLRSDWERTRGNSKLSWDEARPAARDACDVPR
jgi:hypothetical protein